MAKRKCVLITEALDKLASQFVGDGNALNYYFVTDRGHVVTITDYYPAARERYHALARRYPLVECALEDRQTGVIASVEPISDGAVLHRE